MNIFINLLSISFISLLAAISPGPDFFIVMKNSLSYSRRIGILTALGVSLALIIHLSYTLIGLAVLISDNKLLFNLIKYLGVGYLFYIGITALIASFKKPSTINVKYAKIETQLSPLKALRQGFFTNLLNPKAAVFYISLFSQFIDVHTSIFLKVSYAFINWSITLIWFSFISLIITSEKITCRINRLQGYMDRVMGSVFLLLGIKLLFI